MCPVCCVHAIGDEQVINLSWARHTLEMRGGRWVIAETDGEFLKQFGTTTLAEKARRIVATHAAIQVSNS